MRTLILFGLGALGLYISYEWMMKKRSENRETFEKPVVPRDQSQDIIRTPPIATNGKQPWLSVNLNPLYDTVATVPVVGQFLPKFLGQQSGSTPTTTNSHDFTAGSFVSASLNLAPQVESFGA